MGRVFISHSSTDREVATAVCDALEQAGVACWIAPRNIVPGSDWAGSIVDALQECDAVVAIITEDANRSPQVAREVEQADRLGRPLIPICTTKAQPSATLGYFIGKTQWLVVGEEPTSDVLGDLVSAVEHHLAGHPLITGGDGMEAKPHALRTPQMERANQLLRSGATPQYVPDEPPFLDRFVGRDSEVAELASMPDEVRFAMIIGLAGVGKTQLAAEVRRSLSQEGKPVFWRRLHPGDTFDVVATDMAAYMLTRGLDAPAHAISGGDAPESVIRLLVSAMRTDDTLMILDNYEVISSPDLDLLLFRIAEERGAGTLLITTRHVPDWLSVRYQTRGSVRVLDLKGFSKSEAATYVQRSGVALDESTTNLVHERTRGHPLLLDLLISQVISYGLDDEDIKSSLPELAVEVDRYLLDNVFSGLSATEHEIMRFLAVSLLPLSAADLHDVLNGGPGKEEVRTALGQLENRRLVHRVKLSYVLHSIIRDFVYEHIDNVEAFHSRVADLLTRARTGSGKVVQEAHRQLRLSDRAPEADALVIDRFQPLWRSGFRMWAKDALRESASHLDARGDATHELDALMYLGRVSLETCEWDDAIRAYAEARNLANQMGRMDAVAFADNNEAEIIGRKGNFDGAKRMLESSADSLSLSNRAIESAVARLNLCSLRARYGQVERAADQLAELESHETLVSTKLESLRGLVAFESGDIAGAEEACDRDLSLCDVAGDSNGIARVFNNLAVVRAAQGRLDEADEFLHRSVSHNREQADFHAVSQGEGNLGLVAHLRGNWTEASSWYLRSATVFAGINDQVSLCEVAANTSSLEPQFQVGTAAAGFGSGTPGAWSFGHPRLSGLRFLWNVSYGYLPD